MTFRRPGHVATVAGTISAVAIGLLAATTAPASASTAAAAAAAAAAATEIDYHTTGSTKLTNPNSQVTVTFAPTTLQSFVTFKQDNTATLKAFLPLAPVSAAFKAYRFLPVKGTVVFTQVGPETGKLGPDTGHGFSLAVTAKYVVSLRNVVIGGANANVGTNCQTIRPVTVKVSAQPGFNLVDGVLDGTYDLGRFYNCGQGTSIINDTLPGAANTLTLNIHFGDPADSNAPTNIAITRQHVVVAP